MEFHKFITLVILAVIVVRTTLANWMAQNRPLEGQKFNPIDGLWDMGWIILYSFAAWLIVA